MSYTQTPAQQETFLQRQQRLQQTQQQNMNSGSPVSPDGRVSMQAPQQPQTQQQPSAQYTQQNQGATSAPQQWQTTQGRTVKGQLQAPNLGSNPFATYQARQFQTPTPQMGTLPYSYAGSEFTEFQSPGQSQDNAAIQGQMSGLMQAILANPQTMNPTAVAQMKERNKEANLNAQTQLQQQLQQNQVGRNTAGGGYAQALQRQLGSDTMGNVITGNRDIDLAALDRNRQDELNALQAGQGFLTNTADRGIAEYQARLAGEQLQAGDARNVSQDALQRALAGFDTSMQSAQFGRQGEQMGADEAFRSYQSQLGAQQADIERALQQFGVNQGQFGSNLQAELGRGELDLSNRQLAENSRQFNKDLGFRNSSLNKNLGYSYSQLQAQQQSELMNYLARVNGI